MQTPRTLNKHAQVQGKPRGQLKLKGLQGPSFQDFSPEKTMKTSVLDCQNNLSSLRHRPSKSQSHIILVYSSLTLQILELTAPTSFLGPPRRLGQFGDADTPRLRPTKSAPASRLRRLSRRRPERPIVRRPLPADILDGERGGR